MTKIVEPPPTAAGRYNRNCRWYMPVSELRLIKRCAVFYYTDVGELKKRFESDYGELYLIALAHFSLL